MGEAQDFNQSDWRRARSIVVSLSGTPSAEVLLAAYNAVLLKDILTALTSDKSAIPSTYDPTEITRTLAQKTATSESDESRKVIGEQNLTLMRQEITILRNEVQEMLNIIFPFVNLAMTPTVQDGLSHECPLEFSITRGFGNTRISSEAFRNLLTFMKKYPACMQRYRRET